MSEVIKCSKCGLICEPGCLQCDCGFEFATGQMGPGVTMRVFELSHVDPKRAANIMGLVTLMYMASFGLIQLLTLMVASQLSFISMVTSLLIGPLVVVVSYASAYASAYVYNWIAGRFHGFTVTLKIRDRG